MSKKCEKSVQQKRTTHADSPLFIRCLYDLLEVQKCWQRRRDLNPRAGCPTYRISSADPSATWVLLRAFACWRRSLKKSFII